MGTVRLDPSELRRVAERLLGDQQFDYSPELERLVEQLRADSAVDTFDGPSDESLGFIQGLSGIGGFHATCMDEIMKLFLNLDRGLVAMSNVLASVSEDFTETDVDSEASTSAIMQYFTPQD